MSGGLISATDWFDTVPPPSGSASNMISDPSMSPPPVGGGGSTAGGDPFWTPVDPPPWTINESPPPGPGNPPGPGEPGDPTAPPLPTPPVAPPATPPPPDQTGAGQAIPGGVAKIWQDSGRNPQRFVQAYIASKGLTGKQSDKDAVALNDIIQQLKFFGVNAELDTRSDGLHKGIMIDGRFVKLLDGSDNWIWDESGGGSSSSTSTSTTGTQKDASSSASNPVMGPNDQGAGVGQDLVNALIQRLMGAYANSQSTTATQESPENAALRTQILAAIKQLIEQGQQPVGDVSGTPEAKAYALASQRNAEHNRSAAMERRASQGLLFSGPAETDINAVQQQQSEQQSSFEAQLTHTILMDRQSKLQNALAMGAGILGTDQQFALQKELQKVNAELARNALQLQLVNSLLGNQRFYDQLGFDIGKTELAANQSSIDAVK